jgi:nitrile hydratase
VRTPWFVRGRTGVVSRVLGEYSNPEELAYGRDGQPRLALYEVRFRQRDLWPDYAGADRDTVDVDVYEHWLERARAER